MHGARKLAIDHLPRIFHGKATPLTILDLGCGDGEITRELSRRGAVVMPVDMDLSRAPRDGAFFVDVTRTPWTWCRPNSFDAVVACYTLQHLLGDEAAVWREIRRVMKPDGVLYVTGRYNEKAAPTFESGRGDPLRSDDHKTLLTLARSSGLELESIFHLKYGDPGYVTCALSDANAFVATFRRHGHWGLSWDDAKKRYDLLSIEGWMSEEELKYLYETAKMMGGGTVVEIGSFMGRSTCAILAGLAEGRGGRLISIDPFDARGTVRFDEVKKKGGPAWLKAQLLENVKRRGLPAPFVLEGDATHEDVYTKFSPGSIDWLFVDGDHAYDAVRCDLETWVPRVVVGGLVTGHDYDESWKSVQNAVHDYFNGEPEWRVAPVPGTTIWRASL